MLEFTTDQINQVQRLSTYLSQYYKWEFNLTSREMCLSIRTDEWFTLIVYVTPTEVCSNWQFGNKTFHRFIGWIFLLFFKNKHHAHLEKQTITYLEKVMNKTFDQIEPCDVKVD